jgi:hypothetical protein
MFQSRLVKKSIVGRYIVSTVELHPGMCETKIFDNHNASNDVNFCLRATTKEDSLLDHKMAIDSANKLNDNESALDDYAYYYQVSYGSYPDWYESK